MASLWEMLGGGDTGGAFTPTNLMGQGTGFNEALQSRQNSLVGLGLGLLGAAPMGETVWGNAMKGYQAGAGTDASTAYRAAQLRQQRSEHAADRAFREQEAQRAQRNWEQTFQRGGETEAQRAWRDIQNAGGGAAPPGVTGPSTAGGGVNYLPASPGVYGSGTAMPTGPGFGTGGPSAAAAAPGGGMTQAEFFKNWYAPKGEGNLAAQAGQRQQIATQQGLDMADPNVRGWIATGSATTFTPKPTASEETAIAKADDAVVANRNIMQTMTEAKQLSKKAASGMGAYTRGYVGQFLPGQFGEGGKETMDLHNLITTNAVEQLKSIFGGNPSEGERKILLEVQGSVDQSDEVRQRIYDRAMAAAQNRIAINQQRAQQLRAGTYYKPGGGGAPAAGSGAFGPQSDPLGLR